MIQQIPQGLLLGQDHPSLGGGAVAGSDQDDGGAFRYQVGDDGPFADVGGAQPSQGFLQFPNARAGFAADAQGAFHGAGGKVGLGYHRKTGDLPLPQGRFQILFQIAQARGRVQHDEGDIRLFQHIFGPAHPFRAQFAFVVQAGGVDEHHRAQGQNFHGFHHGVGGSAGGVGYDGGLLGGDGVHQAGFARVSAAEQRDVDSIGGGGGVHAHVCSSFAAIEIWSPRLRDISRPIWARARWMSRRDSAASEPKARLLS